MNLFLRAKHWQIFILIFAIPQVMQVVLMNMIYANPQNIELMAQNDPEAFIEEFFSVLPWLIFLSAVISMIQYGWYCSVALGLRKYTPESVRLNTTPFYIAFGSIILALVGMFGGLIYLFQDWEHLESFIRPKYILLFLLFTFVMVAFMLYMVYYTGKAYKTALLKRKVEREEVIGEFFMGLFLFVGVWLLQPKINEMIQREENPPMAPEDTTDFNQYSN